MSEQLYIIVSPVTGRLSDRLENEGTRFKKEDLPAEVYKRVLEKFGHDDPTKWKYVGTCSTLIVKLAPQESEGS